MYRFALAAFLGCASVAYAGRPLITNDADIVPVLKLQLESGVDYIQDSRDHQVNVPATLTLGITEQLEAAVSFGWQHAVTHDENDARVDENGCTDVGLAAKWHFWTYEKTDHALALGINLPAASRRRGLGTGETDYDLTYILSLRVSEAVNVHLNLGYTFVGNHDDLDTRDYLHYSAAITWQLDDKLQPVLEIFTDLPTQGGKAITAVNAGIRYQLFDNVTLDAALSTKLAGDYPDLAGTIGFTWLF